MSALATPPAPVFDAIFSYNVMLPLAEAAYDIASDPDPSKLILPAGFVFASQIVVDPKHLNALLLVASIGQTHLMKAMTVHSNIFGLVAVNASTKTVAVSFRGTETPEDWLEDFDFLEEDYKPVPNSGDVHRGFQMVYESVRASVIGLVQQASAGCSSLWVTGHSLGGALAVLCAPDLAVNGTPAIVPQLHTFAGPRVAHDAIVGTSFRSFFDGKIPICFRVVNLWDRVPDLPPVTALYEHVGHAVTIDGGFTLDLKHAHSLDDSYKPGLRKLLPPPTSPAPRKVS